MKLETNVDQREVLKFEQLASRWWDPEGEFKTLHDINPLRLDYIEEHTSLAIFERRILPILNAQRPSSCAECHLSGVDLKDYIRPDQATTSRGSTNYTFKVGQATNLINITRIRSSRKYIGIVKQVETCI